MLLEGERFLKANSSIHSTRGPTAATQRARTTSCLSTATCLLHPSPNVGTSSHFAFLTKRPSLRPCADIMALYSPAFKITVLFAHFQAAASSHISQTFEVVSGPCTVKADYFDRQCVYADGTYSNGYPTGYNNNQDCVIKQNVHFPFNVHSFDVEDPAPPPIYCRWYDWSCQLDNPGYWLDRGYLFNRWTNIDPCRYDFLEVDGIRYCGKNGPKDRNNPGNPNIWIEKGSYLIWHTDHSITRAGFKLCPLHHPEDLGHAKITVSRRATSSGPWHERSGLHMVARGAASALRLAPAHRCLLPLLNVAMTPHTPPAASSRTDR